MKRHGEKKVETVIAGGHTVHISQLAWRKMKNYTDIATTEVGWLGWVERDEKNPFQLLITDVVLPKQQAHGTTTEIQPNHMHELYEEWETAHGTAFAFDHMERINLWGHSHVNMGPSPSGQDDTTFNDFKKGGKPLFVRLIMNKREEVNVDVADMQYNTLTRCADVYLSQPDNTKIQIPVVAEKSVEDIFEYSLTGMSGWVLNNIGDELVFINSALGVVLRQVAYAQAEKFDDTVKASITAELKDRVLPFVAPPRTTYFAGTHIPGNTTATSQTAGGVTTRVASGTDHRDSAVRSNASDWRKLSNYSINRIAVAILLSYPPTATYISEMRLKHKPWMLSKENTMVGGVFKGVKAYAKRKCNVLHNIFCDLDISLPTGSNTGYERPVHSGAGTLETYSLLLEILKMKPETYQEMSPHEQLARHTMAKSGNPTLYDELFETFWYTIELCAGSASPPVDVEYVLRQLFLDKFGNPVFMMNKVAEAFGDMARRFYSSSAADALELELFDLLAKSEGIEFSSLTDPLTKEELEMLDAEDDLGDPRGVDIDEDYVTTLNGKAEGPTQLTIIQGGSH